MRYLTIILSLLSVVFFADSAHTQTSMYVASGAGNDIVIIDVQNDQIIGRVAELENAHGLSGSPNSPYLVAGSMLQHSPGAQTGASRPAAVSDREHQAHHAAEAGEDRNTSYYSYVSIVHPQHGHVMRRIQVRGVTHHTAVSPDGQVAVAVHSGAGGISVIDLVDFQVAATLQTGEIPNYAVFSHGGKRLYVSNAGSNNISEIDTTRWAVARVLETGGKPEHLVLAPDGSKLFVAHVGEGTAGVIGLVDGALITSFVVGEKPHGIDVTGDGHRLFVSSQKDNKLHRIDLRTEARMTIDLSPAPYHLEYVDEVAKLYVSSRQLPLIWVLDPESLEIVNTIDLKSGVAHQMVIRTVAE